MKQIALFIAFFVMRAAAGQESLSIDLPEAKDVFILPPGSKMPLTRLEREDPQKQIGALVQPAGVRLTLKKGEALELMSDQSGAEEPSFAFLRDLPSDRLRGLTLRCGKFSKDSCRSLSRFRALEHLVVFCADLDIDELAEACPQLELLGIYPTRFRTDDLQGSVFGEATLGKLKKFKNLRSFGTHSNKITDESLDHLTGLEKIKVIELPRATRLSDSGLKKLAKVRGINELAVEVNPGITLDGIKSLSALPDLKLLLLCGGERLSKAELEQYQAALPKTEVRSDP